MCGRFTLREPMSVLLKRFHARLADNVGESTPRYNVAPSQKVLTLRAVDGERGLSELQWGLIPSWAKDAKIAQVNARSETVAEKPMFRSAYAKRRCLVIADGYYEWLRAGKVKLPHLYEIDGGEPFAFAGLWETWQGTETCTILTTEANKLAAKVHDRMPVILDDEEYDDWLAGEEVPLLPFDAKRMREREVSNYVNNARHEGAECIEA